MTRRQAGGADHSLGLKTSDTIVTWGYNAQCQDQIPEPNSGFTALAANYGHSLGLRMGNTSINERGRDTVLPASLRIHSLSPNPFNPSTLLAFETRVPATLTLTVFDLAGHRVSRQDLGPLTAGTHHVRWDGRNTAGHNVSSGLYVLQLETSSGESQSIKGLLVR
jgi:hypothetical protein